MREIKFRSWYLDTKMVYSDDMVAENKLGSFFERYVDSDNVMQFTGLKDRNGKDIYEGDILRILYTDWASKDENDPRTLEQYLIDKSTTGYVAWDEHSTGWVVRVKSKYSVDDDGTVMSSIIHGTHGFREVIGNIHQTIL